ncbi:hypothetical protein V8C40DRAFT_237177 [Trichoderma camerunense]
MPSTHLLSAWLVPRRCYRRSAQSTTDPEALPAQPWRGCTGYPIAHVSHLRAGHGSPAQAVSVKSASH